MYITPLHSLRQELKLKYQGSKFPQMSVRTICDEYFSMKYVSEAEFKLINVAKLTIKGKTQMVEYIP